MKTILKISAIFLIILGISGYFYVQKIKKSALPDYNRNVKMEVLDKKVYVYRDSVGIPHIVAQNEADLYRVVGYLSAQDRLWQMDLLRRVTQGRLSEIFGKDLVDTDVLLRKLQMSQNSEKLYITLDKHLQDILKFYSEGVNRYLQDQKDDLPFEFQVLGYQPEKWQPQHSLNLVGFMSWNLEFAYKMEMAYQITKEKTGDQEKLKELLPNYEQINNYVYQDFKFSKKIISDTVLVAALEKISALTPDIFNGSNNWVVAGKKSVTGKPIFSNDMHLGLDIPGIWTRMHLMIPGQLNVTGVVLPGEPFVVAGHNENIAWGMTNVMLDGADFYMETINPDNKSQYKLNGEWKKMRVKKEKIYIKGEKDPVEKTLYFTHRGPVFSSFDSIDIQPVSMRWIGNEPSHEIKALYELSKAENWDDFCGAIHGFQSVSQNIAYADKQGNIGIHLAGRLPKRTAPGYLFFPGDTDRYDWKGFVPFDSLPYEYNPARGFVSSANNKSLDDGYPYYITEWYDVPYRIRRIRQMLKAKEKLSTADFKKMLFDHHSTQADEIKPKLLAHLKQKKNWNETEQQAIKKLEQWDHTYEPDLSAPLIFDQFLITLAKNLTKDEMQKENNIALSFFSYLIFNTFQKDDSVWADDVNTPEKESFHQILLQSFSDAVALLTSQYGDIEAWQWGEAHQLHLEHPLGKVKIIDKLFHLNRTYPAPGNSVTVNPFTYFANTAFHSNFGASEKHIFNVADWNQSYSILPTGVSGNPASDFYCNQTDTYMQGKVFRDLFDFDTEKLPEYIRYKAVFYSGSGND